MIDVYTLRDEYKKRHPQGHFFDAETLKFFGERFSEMRVLQGVRGITDICGNIRRAYCVSSLQHKAPKGPQRCYHYFDAETFEHIIR